MKNTTVRLATICSLLVLGAFAIALAQHDARNRPREVPPIGKMVSQKTEPISVDKLGTSWLESESGMLSRKTIVRGNDGQSSATQQSQVAQDSDNPLRPTMESQWHESESLVVTASGTQPLPSTSGASTSPTTNANAQGGTQPNQPLLAVPPAWLSGADPVSTATLPRELPRLDTQNAPPLGSPFPAVNRVAETAIQNSQAVPSLPRFPIGGATDSQLPQSANSLGSALPKAPSLPASRTQSSPTGSTNSSPFGATAPWPNASPASPNQTRSFSDTQQPPMVATELGGASGFAQSAPAMPNAGQAPQSRAFTMPASPVQTQTTAPSTSREVAPNIGQPRGPALPTSGLIQSSSPATLASHVSNEPGKSYLDGSQNGNVLIQKRAPEEIQVGRKAPFVITVRNAGNATAHEVMVVDRVPKGAEFAESSPPVTPSPDGLLIWMLGEMAPGDERTINLQIIPLAEGEIGSVAKVYSAAQASVRTMATLPKLEISHVAQSESMIGGRYEVRVTINNTGTGVARNVRLEADLPALVRHESGEVHLETLVDQLPPNGSVTIPLICIATEPGEAQCMIRALTDEGIQVEHNILLRVLAPSLQATMEGPNRRFLERQATYSVKIQNNGSAAATNCDFVMRLPTGLKFNSANNYGSYDPSQHAVFWNLPELPATKTAVVEVTLLPVETGSQVLTFQATGDLDAKAEVKGQLVVEGQAELAFTIEEDNDPIETFASTTYSVRVTNMGSRPDQNVRLVVQIPAGSQVLNVNAPVQYELKGDQLIFEPLAQMDGKDQRIFRFELKHTRAGTQVVRAQLSSQNWTVPVHKEEGTHVYDDGSP